MLLSITRSLSRYVLLAPSRFYAYASCLLAFHLLFMLAHFTWLFLLLLPFCLVFAWFVRLLEGLGESFSLPLLLLLVPNETTLSYMPVCGSPVDIFSIISFFVELELYLYEALAASRASNKCSGVRLILGLGYKGPYSHSDYLFVRQLYYYYTKPDLSPLPNSRFTAQPTFFQGLVGHNYMTIAFSYYRLILKSIIPIDCIVNCWSDSSKHSFKDNLKDNSKDS